jgi:hypothetical protein
VSGGYGCNFGLSLASTTPFSQLSSTTLLWTVNATTIWQVGFDILNDFNLYYILDASIWITIQFASLWAAAPCPKTSATFQLQLWATFQLQLVTFSHLYCDIGGFPLHYFWVALTLLALQVWCSSADAL